MTARKLTKDDWKRIIAGYTDDWELRCALIAVIGYGSWWE